MGYQIQMNYLSTLLFINRLNFVCGFSAEVTCAFLTAETIEK